MIIYPPSQFEARMLRWATGILAMISGAILMLLGALSVALTGV
jgi:hypothetical protein